MEVRNYIRNNWKHSIRTKNKLGNSIPVPFPYTSPCAEGLFDELYYWDTYFLNRGLLQDKEFEQVKNNIFRQIMTKYYVYVNVFGEKYIKKARFYSNLA